VVTFSWRGLALIDGLGIAAATGIGVGIAAATGAALVLATAMDAVGFGAFAGIETGAAASAVGVGVTSGSGSGPPKRIALTSARAIYSAPPTTAPITRFRFGDRAGGGEEATAEMVASDRAAGANERPSLAKFSLSAFQNASQLGYAGSVARHARRKVSFPAWSSSGNGVYL
jgi:hypothetical protein